MSKTRRIILIGNGKSALQESHGKVIDSKFDHIIRFNNFHIHPYQKYIGKRIDIICMIPTGAGAQVVANTLNMNNVKDANRFWFSRPLSKCGKEYKRLIRKFNIKKRNRRHVTDKLYNHIKKEVRQPKKKRYPSTGMVAIEMALNEFPNHDIYILGFDFFRTGHYYENIKIPKCHPVHKEKKIIQSYLKTGILKQF